MSNAIDLFVNSTAVNVRNVTRVAYEARLTFDWVNEAAFPVIVYERAGEMVGWWDGEMSWGYIA